MRQIEEIASEYPFTIFEIKEFQKELAKIYSGDIEDVLRLALSHGLDLDSTLSYMRAKNLLEKREKTFITGETMLGNALTKTIIESLERFDIIREDKEFSMLIIFDNAYGKEYSISYNWTLKKLMNWITEFIRKEAEWR